jgi:hypothetical protein
LPKLWRRSSASIRRPFASFVAPVVRLHQLGRFRVAAQIAPAVSAAAQIGRLRFDIVDIATLVPAIAGLKEITLITRRAELISRR